MSAADWWIIGLAWGVVLTLIGWAHWRCRNIKPYEPTREEINEWLSR